MVEGINFVCPVCQGNLDEAGIDVFRCPACGLTYPCKDGIWRFLPAGPAAAYEKFVVEYETIRQAEGRGSDNPDYYRALPFQDVTGRRSEEWAIRGKSFRVFVEQVLIPLEKQAGRQLCILDLGAGNGWLANRIAKRGHRVVAIDLLVNQFDGLGAFIQYETHYIPVQAEFDHLPLADGQADLAIFNASFHYSTDYNLTLSETLRVLAASGQVTVLDTPIYHQSASGDQMVLERQQQFQGQYGFPSNALHSENYLTDQRLDDLGEMHGLKWRVVTPNYGLRWSLRPWIASLRRKREPARFMIAIGQRVG